MRRPFLVLTLLLIGSFTSTALGQYRRPITAEQKQAHREAVAREWARRDLLRDLESDRITLREAARRAGGTLVLERAESPDCIPAWDIRGLTNRSSLVIVGRPLAARVELTDDRRSIATTYSVQVDDTLKAKRLPPFVRNVIVRVPGGRIDLRDGTSAETRSGSPLALGERYVFFLDDERDAPPGMSAALPGMSAATTHDGIDVATVVYTPHRVDRGVFHLQADGKIRSHAQSASDGLHHYDGIPDAVFLAEIRAAIAVSRFCSSCSSSYPIRF